jgi:hypothetical protein
MNTIAWAILAAALACGSGCARPDWIAQTLVTVDVTGTWRSSESGLLELELEQQGTRVSGSYNFAMATSRSGAIEGTVAGDVFRFSQTSGTYGPLNGEMTVSGDEMRGELRWQLGRRTILLLRADSSAPVRSLQP